jgi:chromosome partitioning protein
MNALAASQGYLIPVQPEFFSLEGIVKIRELSDEIRARWNPALDLAGILPTQVNSRRKLTQEILSLLQQEFGDKLFTQGIRENTAVTESSGHGKSVIDYDPSSNGAQDYEAAALALSRKLGLRGQTKFKSSSKKASQEEART